MKQYDMANIRNVALLGSSGSGKTTLVEHILHNAGEINRVGKVEDGNTTMDFEPDEIEKTMSIALAMAHFDHKDKRVNLIDTPGYPEFIGEQIVGIEAVETALITINAAGSFDIGLEQPLEMLAQHEMAKAIVVNRMDNEHADFAKALEMIEENSDIVPAPLYIPIGRESSFRGIVNLAKGIALIDGKPADIPAEMADEVEEYRMKLMEAVAETDDALLEKYFEEGELTAEELTKGLKSGILAGKLVPVFACSAARNIGVTALMDAIAEYMPSPADRPKVKVVEDGKEMLLACDPDGDLLAFIFKSFSDPNLGDVAYVRVFSGTLKSGMDVFVPERDSKDKVGNMYHIMGKRRSDTSELRPGEMGGLVKLKAAHGLNTLVNVGADYAYPALKLPTPVYWKAIYAVNQHDDDKIGTSLNRLLDEDPTIHSEIDHETKQQLLSAMGEQQLWLIIKRLKSRFKVEAELKSPRIPYRETLTGSVDNKYRHKKQTGGRGQYGEVYFKIRPQERGAGFEFINAIVGGTIPSKFIPAIEKGIRETMEKGIIAGCRVVDIAVEVYYGSYHDVDSSEMAFKIASSQCLRIGFNECGPILLEPIHDIDIIIPNEYMGDVMGDISTRRGKIQGMEQKGKKQYLKAQLPLAELYGYFPALKSLTQGRGRFTQTFSHYERVPHDVAQKVIAEYNEQD
ncbi:MAG: elongation factor G [Candidatus Cloacimonetes bacterium]|nr:elongation factor G [Candidatus Cloacimonadota bacterium]